MHPELFKIPFLNFTVHSYGLMLVLGLILGMELSKWLARRSGMNADDFGTAAILALVFGLIGARIAYVIQFSEEFTGGTFSQNAWNAINLTSGGLVYYGGFLFATVALVTWAIWKKIPLLRGMDIVAPCLMIGLAFGRIGCFLNGCCWGTQCDPGTVSAVTFPYYSPAYLADYQDGKIFPDQALLINGRLMTPAMVAKDPALVVIASRARSTPLVNTQLISTITASLIAGICLALFTMYLTPGRVFAVMLILEGITRAIIEGLRVEPTELNVGSTGLTLSQILGIGIFFGGIALWFVAKSLRNKPLIGDAPGYPQAG